MLVGEVFARMGLDDKQYRKSLDMLEGITQKKAMTLGSIFKGAFSFAIGIGLIQGFRSLGDAVTDFINTAARTEVLDVAMKSVARASGYATQALQEHRKAVMDMGIAEQEASQILTRFMQAQLDTADAAKLARVAQDAAVIAGYNSSQAAEQMTEAIAKQRPELLSAFGMTRNMNEIYNDYAKTVGKTNTQLSEAEKKQAMLNYILAEGEKIAGTYEASMGAVGKQIGSLPRYWDTLKNAIAKPFALPAISVIVDGITNSLKNAISWAETNTSTLQMWGQTAAGVASIVVEYFKWWYGVLIRNWQLIKVVTAALLAYATATKIVAGATAIFQAVSLALNGQLTAQIPILSWVSTAMGFYKVQMALAAKSGIVLTGVLAKLRVALYSLWTALGPIGWIILGISAAAGVGMHLWNKYTQSLQKATQAASPADLAKGFRDIEQSSQAAADGIGGQTDAMKDANKAASKNIQSFDEVHQIQEDMAGSGEDMALDVPGLEDIGIPELPDMDLEGMMSGLEPVKGTLSGFWEWIKEQAGNVWEGVKEKWNGFTSWVSSWGIWTTLKEKWGSFKEWAGNLWEGVKEKWNGFTEWVKAWGIWSWMSEKWEGLKTFVGNLWEGVKTKWEGFKGWVAGWAGPLWDGVKEKWSSFKVWAQDMWEGVKTKWGNFTGWVQEKWSSFKTKAGEIWTGIKTNVQTKWEELKTNAPVIWENIKTSIQTRWENLKTSAGETWNNITTGIKEKWNNLKTNAPTVWENIKTSIQDRWDSLVSGASEKWGNIKSTISEKWEELKTNAPTTWENIKKEISDRWNNLKTNAPIAWENIKTSIQDRWENLKANAPTTWENIKKEISDRWEALKTNAPIAWENIRKSINDKWEELKTKAPTTWEEIKKEITDRWEALKKDAPKTWGETAGKLADIWEGIKTSASEKWEGVKTVIKGAVNGIIGFINKFIRGWNKIEIRVPLITIPFVGTVGGWSVQVPRIPEIPMLAKGGLVMDPTLAMLGEAGPEAVIPLGRSGFAEDLADTVAQAVYRAIIDAIRIAQASGQSGDNKELVLKIDNTTLARMQLPAIIREGQRQGLNLVVQPQGV